MFDKIESSKYLTEEEATVCMSRNVIFCVRWKMGGSSESGDIVDTLELEVVVDCSNISRATGKSEIWCFDRFYSLHVKFKPEI